LATCSITPRDVQTLTAALIGGVVQQRSLTSAHVAMLA
jgi:hypothetical protein